MLILLVLMQTEAKLKKIIRAFFIVRFSSIAEIFGFKNDLFFLAKFVMLLLFCSW